MDEYMKETFGVEYDEESECYAGLGRIIPLDVAQKLYADKVTESLAVDPYVQAAYCEFAHHLRQLHGREVGTFAVRQFGLFLTGVRDGRLSDDAIVLINRLGYDFHL